MTCKLSIIIPIYNAENYISNCLKSIFAQSFSDYEVVLVNDGSKDKSLDMCKKIAYDDRRVTVIDKENGGASSARNAGIKAASGEYLMFIDADDYIDDGYLEAMYNAVSRFDSDIAICGVRFVKSDNGKTKTVKEAGVGSKICSVKEFMDYYPEFMKTLLSEPLGIKYISVR